MGLFDKFKQMVGVSGIKVQLVLPQNSYKQGQTITGVVKISGGPEEKLANKLTVTLVECYPEISIRTTPVPPQGGGPQPNEPQREVKSEVLTSLTHSHQQIILGQQFAIPANGSLEFPVSVTVPAQAAVNGPCQEWQLKTELDIAGAFDGSDVDKVTVTPDEQMVSARETICRGAGFPANCLLRVEAMSPAGERVSKRVYYI